MINSINSYSNYNYYTNTLNSKKNSKTNDLVDNKEINSNTNSNNNISNNTSLKQIKQTNSNLVSDKSKAIDKILGYGVDEDGFFTSDFNEAAGIPKDYKIYAKGMENFAKDQINTAKAFTSLDIAKSIGRAYKVFSQLIDEPKGNFTTEDINKIPQWFQWDSKTLQVTKIYTKDEYYKAASSNPTGFVDAADKSLYENSLKNTISFPDWDSFGDGYIDKKSDIFKLSTGVDIGKNIYTNIDGSISKGGVLMAFLASNNSSQFLRGETTVAGKLAGLDDDFGADKIQELYQFMKDNDIAYALDDNIGSSMMKILSLTENISNVEEFKKQWLEMKAKSDAMGEKYKAQIAQQNSNL
ncbi:Cj0814 family flagellar-dependent secreted protein, partial [Campylobacter estrildidarum]|uniref:Cj0814 family flagellar-dependent secreted protein n=1 Tax=Campylobacter estrildidarum TaxID=2510189 RepID=UPI001BB2C88D